MATGFAGISTMAAAREALAEVLDLPDRTPQIILIMQKIMLCRVPDARRFLTDAMDGLIHGGLEHMRRKRREALEARAAEAVPAAGAVDAEALTRGLKEAQDLRREEEASRLAAAGSGSGSGSAEYEPILIVPAEEELRELEALGTQLDAIRLAGLAADLFPDLGSRYPRWRVGRAIFMNETPARQAMLDAAKQREEGKSAEGDPFAAFCGIVDGSAPEWLGEVDDIRRRVEACFTLTPPVSGRSAPDSLFEAIVVSDARAKEFLALAGRGDGPALEYLGTLRGRLDQLLDLEAERNKSA